MFEVEARGVLEVLEWLQSMEVANVEIESDSVLIVNALLKGTEYCWEVGDVLQGCCAVLRSRLDFFVLFVKRQANKVVQLLARVPCLVNSSNVFFSQPSVLLETLMFDSILN